nr:sulfatase-like hydrolase/transferase [Jiangella aurantiaca]
MRAPHHVPREWADRYAGAFDDGWEAYRERVFARQRELGLVPAGAELSRHDPDVQRWEDCGPDERRLYARMMEVFAGFLTHTDHQIGRLIDFLEDLGELDDTVIMVLSDNGASAEGGPSGSVNENKFFNFVPESLEQNLAAIDELGGPKHFNHYPWGWTWAGNTPFRRWKRETYRGGISDPFIVHWPHGFAARGEVRTQFAHAIDMVPTVLDALGLEPPDQIRGVTQSPLEGVSFAHTFDDVAAPSNHVTQYFEMIGHRSIYHDGWRAVCPWPGPSFAESGREFGTPITAETLTELDATGWELYHVAEDVAENHDVARRAPRQAHRADRPVVRRGRQVPRAAGRRTGPAALRRAAAVDRAAAHPLRLPAGHPGGGAGRGATHREPAAHDHRAGDHPGRRRRSVLVSQGGVDGGFTFFVQDGRLHYVYNYVADQEFHVVSDRPVPAGRHALSFEFAPTGEPRPLEGKGAPGVATPFVDGEPIGSGDLPVTIPITMGLASGIAVGSDAGSPVTAVYRSPFPLTGLIDRVVYDLSGDGVVDHAAEIRIALARQ